MPWHMRHTGELRQHSYSAMGPSQLVIHILVSRVQGLMCEVMRVCQKERRAVNCFKTFTAKQYTIDKESGVRGLA